MSGVQGAGVLSFLVFVVNLPFGFWRAGQRNFSLRWLVAIHAPVLLVVGLRLITGIGWQLRTLPLSAAAFFAGQFLGGKLRSSWRGR